MSAVLVWAVKGNNADEGIFLVKTFFVLLAAAGLAAGVVWRASAPAAPRARAARTARRPSIRRRPAPARPFELPPSQPAEASPETFVLVESTIPDERPSRLIAALRLVVTVALVGAAGVALLAALWLVLAGQLRSYFG